MSEEKQIELFPHEVLEDMGFAGLKIVQNERLYRFTSDSVLLSKFANPKKRDTVADFCAGSGIIAFHFHALHRDKFPDIRYTLFEMQGDLMNLAQKTAKYNGFGNFSFVQGKLQEIPKEYHESFSLILCNPPYERAGTGFDSEVYEKAVCRKEITLTLPELCKAIAKCLKFGGRLAMIHRADRVAEICYTLKQANIEVKKMQFVGGRYASKPYLVLIEGVKGGKPNCEILPTIYNE